MGRKQKNKVHLYFRYVIIILIASLVIFSGIFYFNLSNFASSNGEQVIYSNKYYVLRGKPTNLQKDLFKQLSAQVDKNIEFDMDLIELVVKNFIADYYTWSNKQGPYDIGGGEYIFSNENLNFKQTARRYFYSNMEAYINDGVEIKDLIEVESITTNEASFSVAYDYYGKEYTSFYVEANWKYKDTTIDTTIFPTFGAFTIILNEDGRYEIVRFY